MSTSTHLPTDAKNKCSRLFAVANGSLTTRPARLVNLAASERVWIRFGYLDFGATEINFRATECDFRDTELDFRATECDFRTTESDFRRITQG
jgi:hypothetical protein